MDLLWEDVIFVRNKKIKDKVGLPEFESGSLAPKAKRMDQATPRAQIYFQVT
jgi:hypothetical protein